VGNDEVEVDFWKLQAARAMAMHTQPYFIHACRRSRTGRAGIPACYNSGGVQLASPLARGRGTGEGRTRVGVVVCLCHLLPPVADKAARLSLSLARQGQKLLSVYIYATRLGPARAVLLHAMQITVWRHVTVCCYMGMGIGHVWEWDHGLELLAFGTFSTAPAGEAREKKQDPGHSGRSIPGARRVGVATRHRAAAGQGATQRNERTGAGRTPHTHRCQPDRVVRFGIHQGNAARRMPCPRVALRACVPALACPGSGRCSPAHMQPKVAAALAHMHGTARQGKARQGILHTNSIPAPYIAIPEQPFTVVTIIRAPCMDTPTD